MKIFILIAALLFNASAFAAIQKEKAELIDTIKSIQTTANSCNQTMQGDLILNKMKADFAMNQSDRSAASAQHTAIYDAARKCRAEGKIKISESAPALILKLKKYGLKDAGKDYIIQAQTTIEATTDNEIFATENSKLGSIKNRLELELSM